ncbi:MAG TPA: fluoride efflux transporter CrcB [Polyangia bacterium]|nr:fluoride efflux transporter CrcB [Polyangia bacterium]
MTRFLMVCLGGACGTGARYLMGSWAVRSWGERFPFGTLAINAIGSFLLVMILILGTQGRVLSPNARVVLGTGVMGGFTTYSTFNYEALRFLQQGAYGAAAAYVAATLFGCLAAGGLAVLLTRLFV